jgi:hypothetical protein
MTFGNYTHMNTMMMNIKGKQALWGLLLLPFAFLSFYLFSGKMGTPEKSRTALQTVRTADGWGYNISIDKKIIIHQPTIPAIDTVMAFPSEEAAKAVGNIVLNKVRNHENFTVTREEITHTLSLF